jgi:RNA polymerase primary sigma factor
MVKPGRKLNLRSQTATETGLSDQEIAFIPNDDFVSTTEQDFAELDVQLYAEEDDRPDPRDPRTAAESFLMTVEQSRILTKEGEQFLFKRLNFLRFRANALQATLQNKRKAKKTQIEIDRLLGEANDTREQIACANLRLITSIVRKLSKSPDEFDEFLAEANAILLNAIDKFDYGRGYRFSTYATHAVQRHTFRLIERQSKRRKRESADSELVQVAASRCMDDTGEMEVLAAVNEIVASFDTTLDERECYIVRGRFGLDGSGKGKSLRVIGDELGLSKERVRQLLQQSIEKLAEIAKPLESLLDQ